jgi:polysaccharide export outer membrane protein
MLNVPSIGAIKAVGLTVRELREEILKKVDVFLENPSVNIRLINFKISVQGEVTHPGTFQLTNERITIIEALSLAGDLTSYSNREHIMVIREKDGVREFGEINLKDTKFFTSPYYYLQQNDVVYVEPSKGKTGTLVQPLNPYFQPISVALSIISVAFTTYAILKK